MRKKEEESLLIIQNISNWLPLVPVIDLFSGFGKNMNSSLYMSSSSMKRLSNCIIPASQLNLAESIGEGIGVTCTCTNLLVNR